MMLNKLFPILCASFIFLLYSYLSWFDIYYFGDFGFTITNFKYFMSNPESVTFWFANWLTLCAGWLVENSFSEHGMKIFEIACAAIYAVNFLIADKIVSLLFKRRHTSIVFLTSLFILTGSSGYINRYSMTALLLNFELLFLTLFILRSRYKYLFVAGVIAGFLPFTRLPNISLVILPLAFLLSFDFRKAVKDAVIFYVMMTVGVLIMLGSIYQVGHWDFFLQGLNALFSKGTGATENHNVFTLIWTFVSQISQAVIVGGPFAVVYIYIRKLGFNSYTENSWANVIKSCAIFATACAVSWVGVRFFEIRFWHRFIFTGFLLTALCYYVYMVSDKKIKVVLSLLVLASFVPMLGSVNGLPRNIGGLWVLIPVVLCLIYNGSDGTTKHVHQGYLDKLVVASVLILGVLLWGARLAPRLQYISQCDYYEPEYFKMYGPESEVLKTREELDAFRKYVKKGDRMITYEQSSILHYHLGSIPYVFSPEPIFWGPRLPVILKRALAEYPVLPVVVESFIDLQILGHPKNRQVLRNFLKEHNYQKVWKNDRFTIYIPPSSP